MTGFDEDQTSRVTTEGSLRLAQVDFDFDEQDLRSSLVSVSRLVTDTLALKDLLTRVAEFAVRAIPHADGAGVTLLERGRADTIVASAPFVCEVDAIQYGLGEGPCISAATDGRTVRSGSLGGESLWPRFGPRVGRLGVHSVLSLPLRLPDVVVGAINVYAHRKDAFDEHAVELGELFAAPAAVAVHNAQVLAQTRRVIEQMQAALTSRPVIDQAIGILISRSGGTPEGAFDALRTISQREHSKLSGVARQVVDEAARHARARHLRP